MRGRVTPSINARSAPEFIGSQGSRNTPIATEQKQPHRSSQAARLLSFGSPDLDPR
jgi:hypothetical protein